MLKTKYCLSLILCLLIFGKAFCQYSVKGKVIDEKTNKPLPFVSIVVTGTNYGTTTDIDGKFYLNSPIKIKSILLSYIGYETKTVAVATDFLLIKIKSISYNLNEVVIKPGHNPANRIIKKVIANRNINNPEKSTDFQYNAYTKFYVTAKIDSTLLNNPDSLSKIDTSDQKAVNFLKKQNLFMMESVTKCKHRKPDKDYKKVIASRVSGLKNPTFSMLATDFQSFSFYKNFVTVFGNSYLSPISPGATHKYLFILKDTTYSGKDTTFIMSFRPKEGKNFKGLKGMISINTNGYAVQNIIASPYKQSGGVAAKIIQKYELIDGKQWFPTQLNTVLIFNNISAEEFRLMGVGHSYLENIDITTPVAKKEIKNVAVDISPMATKRPESFWDKYRHDSLSEKDLRTYHVIDSVGKANHFDRKLKLLNAISSSRLPLGPVSLDLDKIINFDDYENFRLGLGFHTNDKISKIFSLGAYGAYGTGDNAFKYGGDFSFKPRTDNEFQVKLSYKQDVTEFGGASFFNHHGLFDPEQYRRLFINRMDSIQQYGFLTSFRIFKYMRLYGFYNKQDRIVTSDYYFADKISNQVTLNMSEYDVSLAGFAIRYAYDEQFYRSPLGTFSLGTKYPVIWIKYTHGMHGWATSDYFNKIDIQIDAYKKWRHIGTTSVRILAGYVDKAVPASFLYNMRGTFKQYTIEAPYTFETMKPNSFLSNQYVNFFFVHNFKGLLFQAKHFKPQLKLYTNIGFGTLSHPKNHKGMTFNTMEKGYYESGIGIDNILKSGFTGLGVAGFYHYGPCSSPYFKDNVALKFTINFAF